MSSPGPLAPVLGDVWPDYTWIVVCAGFASFYMAWGIGANDVANSFATSVGSKTLRLWQAVVIAGVFEFVGAIALGGATTKTVASDIARLTYFQDVPEIYMYGMLCSLAVAGTWLIVATYWCLPVSTTHSIIGSIMGFALVYGGWNGVLWHEEKGDFPYTKGFLPVVLSWFFSPIIGGILAAIIFFLARLCILRRKNSSHLAIWALPLLLFITFFINLWFVIVKGHFQDLEDKYPCTTVPGYKGISYKDCTALNKAACWIAASIAAGVAVLGSAVGIPLLRRTVRRDLKEAEEKAKRRAELEAKVTKGGEDIEIAIADLPDGPGKSKMRSTEDRIAIHAVPPDAPFYTLPYHYVMFFVTHFVKQILKGLYYEVHSAGMDTEAILNMHNAAEVFPVQTEMVFKYLQVFSACCVAFAHGANDVANSIGPFSGIYTAYQTHAVPTDNAQTEKWIFAMGGVGIVMGLMMYGYNIIMQIGVKMLHLTPSRGFSAELGAGLTISLASFYGIPVSTTQIIVGCEIGVGLLENVRTGLNFPILLRTFMGWIWTILLAVAFTAALFAMGGYAPSIIMANQIRNFRYVLYDTSLNIYTDLNATNLQYLNDPAWWNGSAVSPNGDALNATINKQAAAYKHAMFLYDSKKKQYAGKAYISNDEAEFYFDQAQDLFNSTSNTTIGVVPPA